MNVILTLGAILLLAPLTSTFAQSNWEIVDAATAAGGRDNAGDFIGLDLHYTTTSAITAALLIAPTFACPTCAEHLSSPDDLPECRRWPEWETIRQQYEGFRQAGEIKISQRIDP